jgi:phosphohistidine swiveling domain-containing protein
MPTLWMKFPDEVLFSNSFSNDDKKTLESVFSLKDESSAWRRALSQLNIKCHDESAVMLRWYEGAPYFNWNMYVRFVSGYMMDCERDEDADYRITTKINIKNLWALLKLHWSISRFLNKGCEDLPKLVESLALGIALQASIMRLGNDQDKMAQWLSNIDTAPKQHRAVLQQIQRIQMRRTDISQCWRDVFTFSNEADDERHILPEYFWDDDVPVMPENVVKPPELNVQQTRWQGKSVCMGHVVGLAVAARPNIEPEVLKALKEEYNAPLILVFKNARPETVELFQYADAVLFGTGGVLCHACTVARDMQLPSITAIGADLFQQLHSNEDLVWLEIDGQSGTIGIVQNPN